MADRDRAAADCRCASRCGDAGKILLALRVGTGESPHRKCTAGRCLYPGFAESGGGSEIILPGPLRIWFPGCPAQYRGGDVAEWIEAYAWLEQRGKTPVDLGLIESYERLSPQYFDVVDLIDGELARQRDEALKPKPPMH